MIKEALEYIIGQAKPEVYEINDRTYTMDNLKRVKEELTADTIEFSTLQGIVTYLKSNIDDLPYNMIVHVISPTQVAVLSELNLDREREIPVGAKAIIPEFRFGIFMDSEEFLIGMQSKFVPDNEDYAAVLAYAGTTEAGTVQQYSDDGVSQSATVKVGISRKEQGIVPNPVTLTPYRTFTEVEQPSSKFIFRMDNKRSDGVTCALFEADGKSWRKDAMDNIKKYLEDQLQDLSNVTVIS
jgi:hypothetical protein